MENKETLVEKYQKELAVLIAVQHLGQPTLEEIKQYTEHMKDINNQPIKVQLRSVKKYCTILQKKTLISSNYRSTEDGQVLVFNMQRGYVKLPEISQIRDILKCDSLKIFLDKLDDAAGIKKKKGSEFNDYLCKVTWKVLDGIGGFFPNKDGINCHYRDDKKNIMFLPNHFVQYLKKNMSKANKSIYTVDHIGCEYGHASLSKKPFTDDHVVLVRGDIRNQSGGAGFKTLEILPPDTEITTRFSVPRKEFSPEQFKGFLEKIGLFGNVGFGGYARRWGKMEVINFEVIKEKL